MPRQAAPAKIRALRGATPSRAKVEPKPLDGPPEPPDFLDDGARRYWDFLIEQTEPMGTLCKLDSLLLGLLADSLSRADKARELCRKSTLIMGSNGEPKRSPANLILKDCVGDIVRLSRELGLSPAVRHGLNVGAKSGDNLDGERLLN